MLKENFDKDKILNKGFGLKGSIRPKRRGKNQCKRRKIYENKNKTKYIKWKNRNTTVKKLFA